MTCKRALLIGLALVVGGALSVASLAGEVFMNDSDCVGDGIWCVVGRYWTVSFPPLQEVVIPR